MSKESVFEVGDKIRLRGVPGCRGEVLEVRPCVDHEGYAYRIDDPEDPGQHVHICGLDARRDHLEGIRSLLDWARRRGDRR